MTIDEKINRLRESAEKYRANTNAEPQNSFEAEAKKVAEHEAEKNKQTLQGLGRAGAAVGAALQGRRYGV